MIEVEALTHAFQPHDLISLLTTADVVRIVTEGTFVPTTLRLFKDGLLLPDALYTTAAGVDPQRALALHEQGATMTVQFLEEHWGPVRVLADRVADLVDRRCTTVAFWTPPNEAGMDRHSDDHDVLLLQTIGSKAWEVHHPSGVEHRVLHAGEAMVIPEGVDHCGHTLDEESLHVTVAMYQRA